MKKIFVDFDDTMVDLVGIVLNGFNIIYGETRTVDNLNRHIDSLGLSRAEINNLYSKMEERGLWTSGNLFPGVRETINNLRGYEWNILTAREQRYLGGIRGVVNRENLKIKNIYGVEASKGPGEKAEFARRENADIVIEDTGSYAIECAKEGMLTYLIHKPWNKDVKSSDNLVVVEDWREIRENLVDIKTKFI